MSNSLPRTMRRNAAMRGSTSSKSNAKVAGLTVPSLSAWLLPWLRVTVLSLSSAMSLPRVLGGVVPAHSASVDALLLGTHIPEAEHDGSPLSRGRHRGEEPYTVTEIESGFFTPSSGPRRDAW